MNLKEIPSELQDKATSLYLETGKTYDRIQILAQVLELSLIHIYVKKDFEIRMPDVGEYDKDTLLSYEKEVLGIYLSGHPLERYSSMMEKMISAKTTDFQADEEGGIPKITDGQKVIVGGMIADKTIKYTKTNKVMAFFTLEDLVGTVEVVVFPRDYEKWQKYLNEDARVFVQGHVDAGDDRASKLILEKMCIRDRCVDYNSDEKFSLRNAVKVLGEELVGKELMEKYNGWPMYSKFFDNENPLFHHLHLTFEDAARVGKLGKPECYYFPKQLNNYFGEADYTYFGFDPDVDPEEIKDRIRSFENDDTRITDLSRAYRIELGTGWYLSLIHI